MLLAIGALGQLELQACALDRWAADRMVSPSRSARSSSSFVQYTILSSEREIPASLKMQPRGRRQKWTARRSKEGHRHEHSENNTLVPKQYPGGSLDMRCSRRESCSRVFTPALYSRPLGCSYCGRRRCLQVPSYTRTSRSP